jgi:eukaryotic-like serine/threonine-protein kinase
MNHAPASGGPAASTLVAPDAGARRYRVFLSYSHADTTWARWLMRRLESFRVPERFHGRAAPIGELGARIAPVFRDRDELPTADDLGDAVRDALARSATLVVICSRSAARSRWVNEEILAFKRLGRSDRVFALIVDGEPCAKDEAQECFPPALRFTVATAGGLSAEPVELIAADARTHADGKETAFIRLVAGLIGVGFDELRQRELQRRRRRTTWIAMSSAVGVAILLGMSALAWVARNDAQRRQEKSEALMARMLDDLKTRLEKADRLDALDSSGNDALAYFQSLNPRDLTDTTLTQQAKVLTQVGQMRIAQLRYSDATASFTAALKRSAALVERHPRNGDMLFERAQAEYWIGNVHYKKGEYTLAGEWCVRYRDTAVALAGLDPKNQKWLREAVSGHHNLAVLELDRGNLGAARNGFLGERAALEKITMSDPNDAAQLQSSLGNVDSYLGTVAERAGDYPEAIARFGAQAARIESLLKTDPRAGRLRQRLATALGLQSDVMAVAGQVGEAIERRQRSQKIFGELVNQDPANAEWLLSALSVQLKVAVLLRAQGDLARATQLVRECRPEVERLAKGEASNRAATALLAAVWRVEAQCRDAAGEPNASDAAAQAVAISKQLVEQNRASESNLGDYANTCVVAGSITRRSGDADTARRHFEAAIEVVQGRAANSNHWRLLDPLARALMLVGRTEESRVIIERLQRLGFQPLEPWP